MVKIIKFSFVPRNGPPRQEEIDVEACSKEQFLEMLRALTDENGKGYRFHNCKCNWPTILENFQINVIYRVSMYPGRKTPSFNFKGPDQE